MHTRILIVFKSGCGILQRIDAVRGPSRARCSALVAPFS